MHVKHIGLVCSSENRSDTFYQKLLGLEKTGKRIVPAALMGQIFNCHVDCTLVNYVEGALFFEIFIIPSPPVANHPITHVCLDVGHLEQFLQNCRGVGVTIRQIPKGDGALLTFIADFDGNLFEIKGS